jgi:two-component system chemotaxis response regulator CheB
VFVVVHFPAHSRSVLPQILARRGWLRVRHAEDGEAIEPGTVYVAPPDLHLLVKRGHVRLVRGPRENAARPAVDPLFRTAAAAYNRRVVGVVLTGNLDDGTSGLFAVKARGGVAVVQDPEEALYSGMPTSALANVDVDHVLPVAEIASVLERLARTEVEEEVVPDPREMEIDIAEMEPGAMHRNERPGVPSGFSCPGCHGVLWEMHEGEVLRFRCRVGHAFSVETLLAEQAGELETALWAALQALEERAALTSRMAERMRERGQGGLAGRYGEQAEEATLRAEVIRQVLLRAIGGAEEPGAVPGERTASD